MANNEDEKKKERKLVDHEYRLRELSDSIKHNNILTTGVPEEKQEKGAESLSEEIMAPNFPNLGKEMYSSPRLKENSPEN